MTFRNWLIYTMFFASAMTGCASASVQWMPQDGSNVSPPRVCQSATALYENEVPALQAQGAQYLGRLALTADTYALRGSASSTGAAEMAERACEVGGTHYAIVGNAQSRGATRVSMTADVYRVGATEPSVYR